MFQYSGNSASYPANIGIMDDSDTPNFTNLAVGMEGLADRSAWVNFRFVDGVDGGVYNPSNPITLGDRGLAQPSGAQWNLEGTLYFDGTLTGPGVPQPLVNLDGVNATLALTSGAEAHVTDGALRFIHGGGWEMQTGTSAAMAAGTELDVASGATIFVAGPAGITVESPGGSILVQNNGTIELEKGNDLLIDDATNPLFASPRVRSITQPLIQLAGSNFAGTIGPDSVQSTNGGVSYIPITKRINGATLDNIVIKMTWSSAHTPTTLASITLYRANANTGAAPVSVATRTVDPSGSSGGLFTLGSIGEVIDDTVNTYYVRYTGEGDPGHQNVTWWPPIVTYTNITELGER